MSATLQSVTTEGWWGGSGVVLPPSKPVITARVWGSGKVRIDWTASSGTNTYVVKRGGTPIATGLIDTVFYLDVDLAAGNYTYIVSAVGASTVDSDPVTVTAELTDSELSIWNAFVAAMEANAALVAFRNTAIYSGIETACTVGNSPLLLAWPWISDPSGDHLSLKIAIQARVYGTTNTIETTMMTFIKLIREAIATIPGLDATMSVTGPTCVKVSLQDTNVRETLIEFTQTQV